jgi:hypothetical protein
MNIKFVKQIYQTLTTMTWLKADRMGRVQLALRGVDLQMILSILIAWQILLLVQPIGLTSLPI